MALLVVFAGLAGAGTALSPCVLPVLPALLSAGATGGRRRPLGVAIGLATTFTITIIGLATVVKGVGLGDDFTRRLAIVVLAVFGLAMMVPSLAARLEAPLAPLSRFGPRDRGDGLRSGLGVGAALGFVYAPCAGPILAAVITVGAATSRTIPVAIGFAAGSALVLLALAFGGRAIADRIRAAGRGVALQRVLGAVLVLTAVAMASNLDVRFQGAIARHLPAAVVDPTRSLETSHAVVARLDGLRAPSPFATAQANASEHPGGSLPDLGPAPGFVDNQRWFNTPGGRPLTMRGLRGHVVLVDFWTYTCINCLRTLPYLKAWDARYRRDGLVIVGVHSPEFPFEHDASNVADAIRTDGIRYPVAQDNDLGTWNAYHNQYWPAEYLIDADGRVRETHFGEGSYAATERHIRTLLAQAGHPVGSAPARPRDVVTPSSEETPETYLGLARAVAIDPAPSPGSHTYRATPGPELPANAFSFDGTWTETQEAATAGRGARIDAHVVAKDVYLVLSPPKGGRGRAEVSLDGRHRATLVVDAQRLYHLVSLARPGDHALSVRLSPGVGAYSFTFG